MIYFILPAYNEEDNILSVLDSLRKEMEVLSFQDQFRVLAVNDGSTDRTFEILTEKQAEWKFIEVVNHEVNKGVHEAFRSGLERAAEIAGDQDIVIIIEADNTNWLRGVLGPMILKLREGADVICCSRYEKGGCYTHFPFTRLVFSKGANWMLRLIFRIPNVKDYTIFFRGYSASGIKKAIQTYGKSFIERKGFVANAEILIKLSRLGCKASEVPLRYLYGRKRSKSKLRIRKTIWEYFKLIGAEGFRR